MDSARKKEREVCNLFRRELGRRKRRENTDKTRHAGPRSMVESMACSLHGEVDIFLVSLCNSCYPLPCSWVNRLKRFPCPTNPIPQPTKPANHTCLIQDIYHSDCQRGNQINKLPDTESTNSPLMNSLVNFTLTGICPLPAAAMDGEQEKLLVIMARKDRILWMDLQKNNKKKEEREISIYIHVYGKLSDRTSRGDYNE